MLKIALILWLIPFVVSVIVLFLDSSVFEEEQGIVKNKDVLNFLGLSLIPLVNYIVLILVFEEFVLKNENFQEWLDKPFKKPKN